MNALLIIDVQNDFVPGGALAVPEGDLVVPIANRLAPLFPLVVATQDWHPADHASFAASHPGRVPGEVVEVDEVEQVLWPVHCVEGSPGAEFVPGLDVGRFGRVFRKGTDPRIDSYSGFFDNGHRKATGLGDFLRGRGVTSVAVLGLATDYCVKFTVLDALELGFDTTLVVDGCRGVGLAPGDVDRAIDDMRHAGAAIATSAEIGDAAM